MIFSVSFTHSQGHAADARELAGQEDVIDGDVRYQVNPMAVLIFESNRPVKARKPIKEDDDEEASSDVSSEDEDEEEEEEEEELEVDDSMESWVLNLGFGNADLESTLRQRVLLPRDMHDATVALFNRKNAAVGETFCLHDYLARSKRESAMSWLAALTTAGALIVITAEK